MMRMSWWTTDEFTVDTPVPEDLRALSGPRGPALVRVWQDGRTDPGWGEDNFMPSYNRNFFRSGPILVGYEKEMWAFAFVMRSMRVVCLDIDGKNGGLESIGSLGMLPYTLAETSKSGDGYHLFYSTDEAWSQQTGFAGLRDRIGVVPGVDFRATGCVYHYRSQRWNGRDIAPLPQHLKDRLLKKEQQVAAQVSSIIKVLDAGDQVEVLMMQQKLVDDLGKPIPAGKRNNTLFAIGSQMKVAQVQDWEKLVEARADELGLPDEEISKLISNIQKYGK